MNSMQFESAGYLVIAVALTFCSCGRSVSPADLVLLNGLLHTVDENYPAADALAICKGKIVAVGNEKEILAYQGPDTQVINLAGATAIPGFIEGHGHFLSLGRSLMRPQLATAKNWDEVIEMVAAAAKNIPAGEWILARGWHQEKWNRSPIPNYQGLPYHDALSKATPNHPVLLTHASGHAAIANKQAMLSAGIDSQTPDPPGGEIVRDGEGRTLGVFREEAATLLDSAYNKFMLQRTPAQREAEKRQAIELASNECIVKGITTFCDAGSSFETIELFKRMAAAGELRLRLWVMTSASDDSIRSHAGEYPLIGWGDSHLTVRAIKRQLDGALGAHTAWLLEPYNDLPTSTGFNTLSLVDLKETAALAIADGWQLCTHAIGDRANREVLDIYQQAIATGPQGINPRWRVEHAQHLHTDDIPRFSKLGIIAAMQGVHCTSDGPWVPKRIGERRAERGAYVWQDLLKSGALICNGTDAPVEDVDPLASFYSSVTRRLPEGKAFFPKQCMTPEQALRSYTIDAAFAAFEEEIKGSLTPGKLADITILSHNIMTCSAEQILNTEILYTIVGGRVAHRMR